MPHRMLFSSDGVVEAHQLDDVALGILHVDGPPLAPPVLQGRDLGPEAREAAQLGLVIALVDLESEMMERRAARIDGAAAPAERVRQRVLEQADDLRVPTMSRGHAQEHDSVELAKDVQADDVG